MNILTIADQMLAANPKMSRTDALIFADKSLRAPQPISDEKAHEMKLHAYHQQRIRSSHAAEVQYERDLSARTAAHATRLSTNPIGDVTEVLMRDGTTLATAVERAYAEVVAAERAAHAGQTRRMREGIASQAVAECRGVSWLPR